MTCRRLVLCLLSLYHWPMWLLVDWLVVILLFRTSWKRGQSWWVPWNLLQSHLCLWVCKGQLGRHIKPPMGCLLLFWVAGGHILVDVFCWLGMTCRIWWWIGWFFSLLFSILQRSSSLWDGCAPGAEDSGGTTSSLTFAMAWVLPAFLCYKCISDPQ